ncbi:MAG: tetratricopeptide repeat protein [Verrucomicrobia bacterium]|nr:tetratricopeptide repeat protein [Verrucomicrobiota bacterium]
MSLMLGGGCVSVRRPGGVDPLTPVERLNLGVTYEQDGKPDLALREYERAERGNMRATALVYQANLHANQGEIELAERTYREALKVDPDQSMALNNLAWLLAGEGRNLDEAESLIRHALQLNPEPRDPYENTLRTVLERKRTSDPER